MTQYQYVSKRGAQSKLTVKSRVQARVQAREGIVVDQAQLQEQLLDFRLLPASTKEAVELVGERTKVEAVAVVAVVEVVDVVDVVKFGEVGDAELVLLEGEEQLEDLLVVEGGAELGELVVEAVEVERLEEDEDVVVGEAVGAELAGEVGEVQVIGGETEEAGERLSLLGAVIVSGVADVRGGLT